MTAPTKDKYDAKNSFSKEQEHVSIVKVPHENSVRRFQYKGREARYFLTNDWE
jgi:hypothetical protein